MFIDSLPQLTKEQIESIEWQGDARQYDQELSDLASANFSKCFVKNFHSENDKACFYINELPNNPDRKCVIWKYRDEWIAKLFYRGWSPSDGYIEVVIPVPQLTWRKNPDIDFSMTFYDSPLNTFEPDPWDTEYTMVWFIDPAFNHTEDKIWVMTCEVLGKSTSGIKDMGYLTPNVSIEFNPLLPEFELDLESLMPPYWDLCYDCVYALDTVITGENEKMWVVKISPNYRKTKDWKWMGEIKVDPIVVYNQEYGDLDYDLDLSTFNYDDLRYECVYYFDRRHLTDPDKDDVWAFKIKFITDVEGLKVKGHISPNVNCLVNQDLDHLNINLDFIEDINFTLPDFKNEFVWYTKPCSLTNNEKIWLVKAKLVKEAEETKEQALVNLINEHFNVFFISYDEPNADENWKKLKAKSPNAQRIHGVKGIFEAHKKAAELATTDMFFVVDGDAEIVDEFDFLYKPKIFDFDCVHVWKSRNPYMDIDYGYGGVKLLPTEEVRAMTEWENDLTQSISEKFKLIDMVSNITKFNSDPLHTYRSAYRECAKLASQGSPESKAKLHAWLKPKKEVEFSEYVARGAKDGVAHFLLNKEMSLINDFDFLDNKFKDIYGR